MKVYKILINKVFNGYVLLIKKLVQISIQCSIHMVPTNINMASKNGLWPAVIINYIKLVTIPLGSSGTSTQLKSKYSTAQVPLEDHPLLSAL